MEGLISCSRPSLAEPSQLNATGKKPQIDAIPGTDYRFVIQRIGNAHARS